MTRIAKTVRIHLNLSTVTTSSVAIYDVAGHRVFDFAPTPLPAGPRDILWNLTPNGAGQVPSGVYFVRATAGTRSVQIKLVVLR